jgi:hypothetical protein
MAWSRARSSAGKPERTTPPKVAGRADPLAIFGEGKGHVIGGALHGHHRRKWRGFPARSSAGKLATRAGGPDSGAPI